MSEQALKNDSDLAIKRKKHWTEPFMFVAVIAIFIPAIGYSISTRTWDDFLYFSSFVGGALGIFFSIPSFQIWRDSGFKKPSLARFIFALLLIPYSLLLVGAIYYAIGAAAKDFYLLLISPSSLKPVSIFFSGLLTIAFGSVLFIIRLKMRFMYGVTEALVGVAVVMHRVNESDVYVLPTDTGFYLAVLTAGIYLVVRGLDNAHQAWTKDPLDPATNKLKKIYQLWFINRFLNFSPLSVYSRSPS